ncbi:L-fucose/L-arabinose isomerase family protein [Chondrinema litorale]|uniref:L-fucose/L-arabinose isomerase family protein n=1 Tax=Chondrinema litorale TaxID=2994555 RepID=UPI0025436087|nr:L-fucose/L-arabinose isomerase family protein [Chondrinema litorale]UZR98871.1 L-fucose/L-arabinose isomerase family protein [Chondrinema litorale]
MINLINNTESKSVSKYTVARIKPLTAKVGILGVGHHTYWNQFNGLWEKLIEKMDIFESRVAACRVETVSFGISDSAEKAAEILPQIKNAGLDLLFIDMLTYATSSTIANIFREVNIPMVMVALQPAKAMDYENASTFIQLLNDDICAVPEFMNVALRFGKNVPPLIMGTLHDDIEADEMVKEYCQIAKVLHSLKTARIGQMGHVLEAMLDMHTDPTLLNATFGCHIVQTEPDDILQHYQLAKEEEVLKYEEQITSFFDTPDPKSDPITEKLKHSDLRVAARVGVALDAFIKEKKLDGLAYYYEGKEGSEVRQVVTNFIVGNSLLTGGGFPMCGEMDLKTCIAMMIMDRLEMGGSFAEFHPVDFKEGFVLVGHDGPHHINIAEGKPVIRSLKKYHGKPGSGASVEFKIKSGPITMLAVCQKADGSFKFIIAEGESKDGPIPPTGNTNTRGYFAPDVKTFLTRWFREAPTHHFALGIGHRAETIRQIGEFLGVETVIIPTE